MDNPVTRPLADQSGELAEVFVEIPVGGGVRHRHGSGGEVRIQPFAGTDVVPALGLVAYGCVPGTWNPADGGALDAYILNAEGIPPSSRLTVKVLGIRLRNNGDHKLVVAPVGSPNSRLNDISELSPTILETLALWDELRTRPGEEWGSAEEGRAWLNRFRR